MNTVERKFQTIPCFRLGEVPEGFAEKNPLLYRRIVAKRALQAGYEEADIPGQSITDLLSDIRHLCDGLGLDFAKLDRAGYENYSLERHNAQTEDDEQVEEGSCKV